MNTIISMYFNPLSAWPIWRRRHL